MASKNIMALCQRINETAAEPLAQETKLLRAFHLEEPVWLIQRNLAARLADKWLQRTARAPYYGPRAAE